MDDLDFACEASIEVVFADERLIELAATVSAGHWRGWATAYTVPVDVSRFADALHQFADGGPPTAFKAGDDTGIGLIVFWFYRIDRSGHIAGYAQLASGRVPTDHRPEQVSRLAVEFGAEPLPPLAVGAIKLIRESFRPLTAGDQNGRACARVGFSEPSPHGAG